MSIRDRLFDAMFEFSRWSKQSPERIYLGRNEMMELRKAQPPEFRTIVEREHFANKPIYQVNAMDHLEIGRSHEVEGQGTSDNS